MPDIIEEGDHEVSYHQANMPLSNKLSNASSSYKARPSSSSNWNGGRSRPYSINGLHSQSSATTEGSSRNSSSSQSIEGNCCQKSTISQHSSPSPVDSAANFDTLLTSKGTAGVEAQGSDDDDGGTELRNLSQEERLNNVDSNGADSPATTDKTNNARIWQEPKKEKNYVETIQCTTLPACLVLLQLLLGATITTFGFVMLNISPTLRAQDTPYWAGLPLLFTGLCGLYFCASSIEDSHSGSLKAFIIKATCFTLSTICLFINVTASAFTGIHGGSIVSADCEWIEKTKICQCSKTTEDISKIVAYQDAADCEAFLINLETYLFFQCALNAIAGCTCFSLVFLMWSSKFSNFHSGLKFYSYSASVSSYPRANPSSRYSTTLNFNLPKTNRYILSPSLV